MLRFVRLPAKSMPAGHLPGAPGMGGRAVECTGLEIRQSCKRFVGSNPTPSAKSTSSNVRQSPILPPVSL